MKNNTKQQMLMGVLVIGLCIGVSIFSLMSTPGGVELNQGLYGVTITSGQDGETWLYEADNVVPGKDTLISNLQQAGYEIEQYATALDSEIPAERVVATRGKQYIDICYGLTEEEAETIFAAYEDTYGYQKFYVLARNENYVYCVSNKKTFEKSGFTELSNNGVLYLRK